MRACIHRGATQIGGSCVELEHEGSRILIDLGLPLDADPQDATLLPPIETDGLKALIISHPHLDHYGLLHHLPNPVPIAMGEAARRIIHAAADFITGSIPILDGPDLAHRRPITIGPFTITPYLVDHSAYDAYALMIEAGEKRLFYSGDLRDHGRKSKLTEQLISDPPVGVNALLLEGSSLSRLDEDAVFPTEEQLSLRLEELMELPAGLVMVQMSAQNIDRLVSVFKATRRAGRTLLIDLYTASILEATGNPRLPQTYWSDVALCIPHRQRIQIKQGRLFELLDRHKTARLFPEDLGADPGRYVLVFRPIWMQDLVRAGALKDSLLIYSQWKGYLDRGDYARLERWLSDNDILIRFVHTSGHAAPATLKRLAVAIAPRQLVPIHTFERDSYINLFDNVVIHEDGTYWEV